MHILFTILLFVFALQWIDRAYPQQPPTPCEEVRSTLAVNTAEMATQVRTLQRENDFLKTRLAEIEKKSANGKDANKPVKK